jgi:hypothetical protein
MLDGLRCDAVLQAMPLLRLSVLILMLFEILTSERNGNEGLGTADMNAARQFKEFLESFFAGMPLPSFGQQITCDDRLLFPDGVRSVKRLMATTICAASLASSCTAGVTITVMIVPRCRRGTCRDRRA